MSLLTQLEHPADEPLVALDLVHTGLRKIMAEIDSVFDKSLGKHRSLVEEPMPRVDITEDKDTRYYTMELPGVKLEDIRITMEDGAFSVHGVKRREERSKDENHRRYERSYGEFTRTFSLPKGVDAEKIHAELDHGVLEVRFPLPASLRGAVKEIKIASGDQRLRPRKATGHQAVVT
jgi:HSP20 family protein